MAVDFTPRNPLERALRERDRAQVVRFVAEGYKLTGTAPAGRLAHPAFPEPVVQLVLKLALPREKLEVVDTGRWYHYHGDGLRDAVRRAREPLPEKPNAAEKRLVAAVVRADSAAVVELVKEKPGTLRNFSAELLAMLPELTRAATLAFLTDGFAPAAVPEVFRVLLRETEDPAVLTPLPYRKRLMYANLLIHVLQGERIRPDEEWYPMGGTVEGGAGVCRGSHSYCFDPRHRYRPRSAGDGYELPARDARRR